ncbi:hypothetical protein HJG53_04430 [Sphingomonas sp. ID1715]|uniref:hypothetical protein n=1 Tax=Sphingomonas sp. ID1715 TaxID=1656898 RepID=UPI001488C7DA|nr:hypothetical protein [Sphingomonas sp. ID1715]NNM76155.1 hypothetical protein [Sphingomonas sp. ID1715]
MSPLQQVKWLLVDNLHLSKDALHIYVALTLFLGSALLLRWPLKSWRPWLLVLAAAVAGEAWDLRDSVVYGTPIDLFANAKDVANTLFWPTVLMLLARRTRVLKRG